MDSADGVPPEPSTTSRLREVGRLLRRHPGLALLVLRAYLLLLVMRGVITMFPLRRITSHLGAPMQETPQEGVPEPHMRYARQVAWAVRKLAPRTPTNSNCYPQALTAWWLLHRKGIPTTVYYGATFEPDRPALGAHVWVRCGPLIVTGGGTRRQFAPLTWYADDGKDRRSRARGLRVRA
jgi:hypothetical protein